MTMTAVFLRIWIVFVLIWGIVFGLNYHDAQAGYENAVEAVRLSHKINEDTGLAETDAAVTIHREYDAASKQGSVTQAMLMLVGGLIGGSLSIVSIYWIVVGA